MPLLVPDPGPCPNCQSPNTKILQYVSSTAVVWYVRCSDCGNVWTLPKERQVAA